MPIAIDSAILAARRSSIATFLRWIMPLGPCKKSYKLPNCSQIQRKSLIRKYKSLILVFPGGHDVFLRECMP